MPDDMAPTTPPTMAGGGDLCPAKHAGLLTTPLRRLISDPKRILAGLVEPGMTVVDLGCGPGFFTLPLAEMVGPQGRVIAVDLQEEMLAKLLKRADARGLSARIQPHQCAADTIGTIPPVDFALAFYVAHEVPDVEHFLGEVRAALKDGARFLLVEPKGHVTREQWEATVAAAGRCGLRPLPGHNVRFARSRLFGV